MYGNLLNRKIKGARCYIYAVLLLLLIPTFCGAQKNPPPDFTTTYQYPVIVNPGPRLQMFTMLDIAMLIGLMAMTAWYVHKRRSRKEVRLISIFSLLYFGFYRHGCVCAVGSLQNVALAAGGTEYSLPLGVGAFFLLPLLFALFYGRVFCAAVCPLGAVQELALQKAKRVPAWLDQTLSTIPYLYLGAGVLFAITGSAFVICRYDPFVPFFRFAGSVGMLTFGAALVLLSTFIGRPYCRYICPYGVLLRWLSPFAKHQVHVAPAACINCHLCAEECPYGAIKAPTPVQQRAPSRMEQRGLLIRILAILPALVLLGALLGRWSSPVVSQMSPKIRIADRVWLEQKGRVAGMTDESTAWRQQGRANDELYHDAALLRRKFDLASLLSGAWIGLIIGLKLIFSAIHRTRTDYDADPAACLACARCFAACPVGKEGVAEVPEITTP